MVKKTFQTKSTKNIQFLFLILFLISVTTACRPALKEFQPERDSLFKIAFSYPADWVWEKPDMIYDEYYDPLHPLEGPPPSEEIIVNDGIISITVIKPPSDPQIRMQEFIDVYIRAVANLLHADNTIQIDGYNARQLTLVYPPQNSNEAHIQESIYLFVEDRYYVIGLDISESETHGRFQREFTELIKSIKVLP